MHGFNIINYTTFTEVQIASSSPITLTVMVSLSLPIGLVTVHVYVPLSLVVTLLMVTLIWNTAILSVWIIVVILGDGVTGVPSFVSVNVSGGEPR